MGLGWLVYQLSGSTLALGYLGAAAGLPAIFTSLFGGALADRFDKRILLMTTSVLTAGFLGLLAWLDYSNLVQVWHAVAIAGVISFITGFDWPARQAIFPALIEREDMMSAVAMTTIIWQITRMVLPAIGGLVIAVSDTWLLFALCAAGFGTMFFVLLRLTIRASVFRGSESTITQIVEGVRFILTNPTFLILIGLSYSISFFASSYQQLMPAFADLLQVDERGYGYLLSVGGVGSVLGTFISGSLQHSRKLGAIMLSTAGIFSLFVLMFAFAVYIDGKYAFYISLAVLFVAATFISVFMVTSTTVLQLQVPDDLRGRVMGFHAITYNLSPLGGLFSGAIAAKSNAPTAIAAATIIFLILLGWATLTQVNIRRIDGRLLTEF
jgi:MFS family permease